MLLHPTAPVADLMMERIDWIIGWLAGHAVALRDRHDPEHARFLLMVAVAVADVFHSRVAAEPTYDGPVPCEVEDVPEVRDRLAEMIAGGRLWWEDGILHWRRQWTPKPSCPPILALDLETPDVFVSPLPDL